MKSLTALVCLLFIVGAQCNPIDVPASEAGDKWQGDIILTEEQENAFNGNSEDKGGRTGLLNNWYRWPKTNGLVILPYTFSASAGFSANDRNIILSGLREIESKTCIRFVQRTNQNDYVEVINDGGCYSYLGRLGGRQFLSLARNGCVYKGIAMHEFIHALGYTHMQNRLDRDSFVTINYQNMDTRYASNFQRVTGQSYGDFNTPYDYGSVMHYGRYAFSKNGRETITTRQSAYANVMGQRNVLSTGDVTRLRNMYQC